ALPAFTSAATLAGGGPEAGRVPVRAAGVWRAGATDASAVVIDIAGPVPFAVDGARLAALAQGRPPPRPDEDPDVAELAHAALAAEPVIAGYRLLRGEDGTDLTLCLVPVPGCDPERDRFTGAAQRASQRLLAGGGPRGAGGSRGGGGWRGGGGGARAGAAGDRGGGDRAGRGSGHRDVITQVWFMGGSASCCAG